MNVLLVTYSFPPAGGVGVLRALSLAKYLPSNGIRLDVLTARNAAAVGTDPGLLKEVPASVAVHRTWTLDLPFALRKKIKGVLAGSNQTRNSSGAPRHGRAGWLKALIGNLLLPDPQVGWLPFAERAAVQLISKHQIDLVLITVPPFSSVRLVTRLRRRFPSLPMVLDFRDEWLTTTLHLVSFNSNRRARGIAREAEAEAVRDATAVVAVSEGARQEIRSRYPGEREAKFQCIPNGFDSPYPPRVSSQPQAKPEKALIVYIGTVYGSTDPCTFVQAVKALPETVRGLVQIRFIGRIESPRFRDALESLGDTIEIQGFVPQKEALHALQAATYLLLISHDPLNISAKLYDYLGGGKPILGVVHPEGDVRRLIDETRAGLWADVNDVNAIKRMLAKAVDGRSRIEELYRPNSDRIAAYHRKTLADRYAALLQKIVDPSTLC